MGSPGEPVAAPPVRPAATVMLLRDGDDGLQVFVIRRVAGMAFAGGMTAFPGGSVDPSDDGPLPAAPAFIDRLGLPPAAAAAVVTAAVRELFEETGVLLAAPAAGGVGRSPTDGDRADVTAHRRSLGDILAGSGLVMRPELLSPWGRWITPAGQPRRYDTFFFAAAVPTGQRAAALTTEAEAGGWARPGWLLGEHRAERLAMMPPTRAMLVGLSACADASAALAAARSLRPVLPRILSAPGEPVRVEVDDPNLTDSSEDTSP